MQYVLTILIALLTGGVTLAICLIVLRSRRRVERRVEQLDTGSTPELVMGDLTPALAGQLPPGEEQQIELRRELRTAGYYQPTALMEYSAVRATMIMVPLLAAGILSLLVAADITQALYIWIGGVIVALLGYSLPRIYLYYRSQSRMHKIERALPTAIDMLILCLGAGLNVLNSLQRVTQELHKSFPVLAFEFEIVRRQAELRTLEFALAQFAERVGLPQARNLSIVLSQSENLGTDAVPILREFADDMRINMRQRADEMANKAPFKLLFPAYLMAIGAFILLIGPAILYINEFRYQNTPNDILRQSVDELHREAPGRNAP